MKSEDFNKVFTSFGLLHHFKELAQFLTVCLDWDCKGRQKFVRVNI
jgi:hypothetical protein